MGDKALAVTYFRTGDPHYHRRYLVSRSCSGWEGVGPRHYGRQQWVGRMRKGIGPQGEEVKVFESDCFGAARNNALRKVIESSLTGN